jgi:signal transduction histidine kinase
MEHAMLDFERPEEPTPAAADASGGATLDPIERLRTLQRETARIQHEINNPLSALLAEAQLLTLEPALGAEHRVAVEHLIELTRRVITRVRELDAVRGDFLP